MATIFQRIPVYCTAYGNTVFQSTDQRIEVPLSLLRLFLGLLLLCLPSCECAFSFFFLLFPLQRCPVLGRERPFSFLFPLQRCSLDRGELRATTPEVNHSARSLPLPLDRPSLPKGTVPFTRDSSTCHTILCRGVQAQLCLAGRYARASDTISCYQNRPCSGRISPSNVGRQVGAASRSQTAKKCA